MNDMEATAHLEQVKDYFSARGFGEPIGRYLVRHWSPQPATPMWDVIRFEFKTGRWCAYTSPIGKLDKTWETPERFDTAIECYLHAELANWGRA